MEESQATTKDLELPLLSKQNNPHSEEDRTDGDHSSSTERKEVDDTEAPQRTVRYIHHSTPRRNRTRAAMLYLIVFTADVFFNWAFIKHLCSLFFYDHSKEIYDNILKTYNTSYISTDQGILEAKTTSACLWKPSMSTLKVSGICKETALIPASELSINSRLGFLEPTITALHYKTTSIFITCLEIGFGIPASLSLITLGKVYPKEKPSRRDLLQVFATLIFLNTIIAIFAASKMTTDACIQGCNAFTFTSSNNKESFSVDSSLPSEGSISMLILLLAIRLFSASLSAMIPIVINKLEEQSPPPPSPSSSIPATPIPLPISSKKEDRLSESPPRTLSWLDDPPTTPQRRLSL